MTYPCHIYLDSRFLELNTCVRFRPFSENKYCFQVTGMKCISKNDVGMYFGKLRAYSLKVGNDRKASDSIRKMSGVCRYDDR